MAVVRTIQSLGILVGQPISQIGRYTIFLATSLKWTFSFPIRLKLIFQQMEFVGNKSLGVILISASMIGAVFGFIFGDIFQTFGAESMLGVAAGIAMSKELAPVFTGFLVTARAGSAMAAEIGTMRVNEQIDAMRVMSVNPYNYLVGPRLIAGVLMTPLLTCLFILAGTVAAYAIGISFFDVDVGQFLDKMRDFVKPRFVIYGMQKGAVFGAIITSVGCYQGFYTGGGAKGVGKATTTSVVVALVAIIVCNFFLSYLQMDQTF